MTARHQLNKQQIKKEKIEVLAKSLDDFLNGKRKDLDCIVNFENQKQIITAKPRSGYPVENYIPVYNYLKY